MLINQSILNGLPGRMRVDGMDLQSQMPLSFEMQGAAELPQQQNPGTNFADLLADAVNKVEGDHHKALNLGFEFAAGNTTIDPHQVMTAVAKAETELHLTSAVTTRVAQGYQTLMNMQI